ncbi:sigma-54-dependent transcriptional regulator [Desulfomarina sp.]
MTSSDRKTVLVVDDEAIARENLALIMEKEGYDVVVADSGEVALSLLEEREVDLVLTDLRMQGKDGIAVLNGTKKKWPATEVVVITGYSSVETAIEAIRQGAYHYLPKPVNVAELKVLVGKALEKSGMQKEIRSLKKQLSDSTGASRIIGQSPAVQAMRERITQVAQLDCNVLILGETGTGKELVARTIHELSPRSKGRFVAFNCGAFTEELITNELFGHEKEAFTGANREKKGLLELAEGGTVFFDEIGELSLSMQVKLLRVLQERTLRRVGGSREIPIDIRILAATNKDLKQEAENGTFRMDLFYRLDVITIRVPPLAQRRDDIPLLVNHFMVKHAHAGKDIPQLSGEVIERLKQYEYPGNIRELENIAQRILIECHDSIVMPPHLPIDLRNDMIIPTRSGSDPWPSLVEHEKSYIREVLDKVEGNKSKAAKLLGIDRVSLWRKIKRYDLENPDA